MYAILMLDIDNEPCWFINGYKYSYWFDPPKNINLIWNIIYEHEINNFIINNYNGKFLARKCCISQEINLKEII